MRVKLKSVRKEQNLTQQELANIVGISRVHYTQIENSANKNPSLEVALRIKKALNYCGDDLFLISDVPTENKSL
ncbi:MAG: helix-turn-helix domain-containing protein [Lachnospiraceae bacterium]|nr:helix-turn-helix domain-containing protein [Lachnospiraceae bacterium]